MVLIVAISIAILIFVALYARTVSEYFSLLRRVAPVVDGKIKSGFLFSTIRLEGVYNSRRVLCAVEQIGEGGDALVVRTKLLAEPPAPAVLDDMGLSKTIVLFRGWVTPRFYIGKNNFNRTALISTLDKLSRICENLERVSGKKTGEK